MFQHLAVPFQGILTHLKASTQTRDNDKYNNTDMVCIHQEDFEPGITVLEPSATVNMVTNNIVLLFLLYIYYSG